MAAGRAVPSPISRTRWDLSICDLLVNNAGVVGPLGPFTQSDAGADIFDEGRDLPPERPAALLVVLASGKADVLSGRYVSPADDLDRLIEDAPEIKARKLYSLQVQRL